MPSWTTPPAVTTLTPITKTYADTYVRDNTTYLYDLFHTAWTSFTPTLGGTSASLGNGSLACHYSQAGKLVIARYILLGGSTTNLSSDALTLTLPVTARDPGDYRIPIGSGFAFDAGTATYEIVPYIDHTTHTGNDRIKFAYGGTTMADVNDSTPISGFAASDTLTATVMYEAA